MKETRDGAVGGGWGVGDNIEHRCKGPSVRLFSASLPTLRLPLTPTLLLRAARAPNTKHRRGSSSESAPVRPAAPVTVVVRVPREAGPPPVSRHHRTHAGDDALRAQAAAGGAPASICAPGGHLHAGPTSGMGAAQHLCRFRSLRCALRIGSHHPAAALPFPF
eukprot:scaffold2031_cov112-Isochrysis_galbana.AAC.6